MENGKLLPDVSFEPGHHKYEYGGVVKEWEDIAKACGYHKRTVQRYHDAGVEHLAMKMGG